ncbi:MAG: thermonuclease family protein [Conexibacter sp.]|nr:thermonuclease family protein [Conexibacter sp.]
MRRTLPWVLVVLLFAAWEHTRRAGDGDAAPAGARIARVVRVVDGDTLLVALGGAGGARERVRLIGIDTPETVKPDTPVQCFGKRASAETHRLLDDQGVRLVVGTEARDRYGRLLAYAYRTSDGLFVNESLVRGGFARTLSIAPNTRYAARFAALAGQARDAGRGLWSACER